MVDLSVVIVNWNTRELLRACLASLNVGARGISFEVFVVDNASADGSAEMVAESFPEAVLVRNAENVGFSRANNQALRAATGRHVLLLNSDTVVHEESLSSLVKYLDENAAVGAVGPKLLNGDGTVQREGFYRRFPSLTQVALFYTPLRRLSSRFPGLVRRFWEDFDEARSMEVDQIPGAALCVRGELLERVGLLEERFAIWFEDVDWCYRAKGMGARLMYYPGATITHLGGQSFGLWREQAKMLQLFSSMYLFFRIHHGRIQAECMRGIILSATAASVAINFLRKWLRLPGFRAQDYEARKWLIRNFSRVGLQLRLPTAS